MGLLLCGHAAKHPWYYEKLDLNIWSIQELSYALYHYPVMIPKDFVDKKLAAWFREELGLTEFADKLSKFMGIGESQDLLILRILREANYYTEKEIQEFGLELKRLQEIGRAQFSELLGDTFFRMGKYGRAIDAYRDSVSDIRNPGVQMKLADGYASVLQFRKAAKVYEDVFLETGDRGMLRKLFFLRSLDPSVDTISRYEKAAGQENLSAWAGEFEEAAARAEQSERMKGIYESFQAGSRVFRAEAAKLIRKWKKEYRSKT